MACLASAVGWLTGAGAERAFDHFAGAGAFYLARAPRVLGLAFRVRQQRKTPRETRRARVRRLRRRPGRLASRGGARRACGLPADVVLASLPKCTTTGLAVHMAAALGVDPSLAAAGCALAAP